MGMGREGGVSKHEGCVALTACTVSFSYAKPLSSPASVSH